MTNMQRMGSSRLSHSKAAGIFSIGEAWPDRMTAGDAWTNTPKIAWCRALASAETAFSFQMASGTRLRSRVAA